MARHEIKIHANTGATSEKAPFTGSYITKSTLNLDMICAMAANLVGMPELKLKNLLQNSIEAFLDWEREEACRIHIDGGYVEIKLLGSFPAADSTWNPEKNKFVVVFVPDAKTRDHLINETPVIVTDETSTKVRVDNVFDADPTKAKPTEVIYGQNPFVSQGYNQVMSDAGAKAELVNARGVRFDCTVLEEINRQNVKLRTAELLEAGDYRFMLTSRGGDAEGDLQTVMKKVKYLKVTPTEPVIDRIESDLGENMISQDAAFTVHGQNLGDARKLMLEYTNTAGVTEETDWTAVTPEADGKTISVNGLGGVPTGIDASKPVLVRLRGEDYDQIVAELGGVTWIE